MNKTKLTDLMYYVGANNHFLTKFENSIPLPEGVSFNSYLLMDEKTVLFDAVDSSVAAEFLQNVEETLAGRKLDYLVIHHMEPDHSSSLLEIIRKYPDVKLVGNRNTFKFFEQFFSADYQDNYYIIKDGDELNVGRSTLRFLTAALVHWPEVFVTYIPEQKILLSADAFGSFGSNKGHLYSDEGHLNLSEVRRYFVGILAKFRRNVGMLLKKIETLEIDLLLSLHGKVHRDKDIIKLLFEKYNLWANFDVEEKGVVIAYVSMYGNTALAASKLAEGLAKEGVKKIRLYDLSSVDSSYVLADVYRFSNLVLMAPNFNVTLHLTAQHFVTELEYHGLTKRNYSIIVNETWGGRALAILQEAFANMKDNTLVGKPLTIITKLTPETRKELKELTSDIVESLK
ncbi:MAG: FprA family A-type flavoprotein [Acholeplasmataceae bacterium]